MYLFMHQCVNVNLIVISKLVIGNFLLFLQVLKIFIQL